jgi:indolepyruvate decarboxylase
MAGVEIHRFGLQEHLLKFLEASGFPFVTGILGKSVVSEDHPQFAGVYAGAMSPDDVRHLVEDADCVIAIGPLITDLSTGIFTQHIDPGKAISSEPDGLKVKHHFYPSVGMKDFIDFMIPVVAKFKRSLPAIPAHHISPFVPVANKAVTVERLIACLNAFLSDETVVIAEAGDSLFAALDLHVHGKSEFISPAYYASLGFAVPASIGVQLATPDRRPLVIVGDGAFQMSGVEVSTAVRYGLNPIIIVLNNGGYGTFRHVLDGTFNDIQPWNYADITKAMGAGQGYTVTTEDGLVSALELARKNNSSPTIIDARIGKYDYSARLKTLSENLKKKVRQ